MNDFQKLNAFDPALVKAMNDELKRQEEHIELIASENYTSAYVMAAQGSVLTNKYAEGYPAARYYGGCQFVDEVESLAIERAKKLFGAAYANVQPHSGSSANAAVFMALLQPHDKVLGMALSAGGHLTHGAKVSFSGRLYDAISYGVNEDGYLDYDEVFSLAQEHKPKMIIAGFSSYARIVDWAKFREIADSVGAYLLVDMAHIAGLVTAGLYPNPVPYADVVTTTTHKTLRGPRGGLILARDESLAKKLNSAIFPGYQGGPLMHVIAAKAVSFLEAMQDDFKKYQQQVLTNAKTLANALMERGIKLVSGGTDNHLMLINLVEKGITGKDLDASLGRAYITVNKNAIPNDPQSPAISSGIRIGTPAVTTRGFKEKEMIQIASWIVQLIENCGDARLEAQIRQEVLSLCAHFPIYSPIYK